MRVSGAAYLLDFWMFHKDLRPYSCKKLYKLEIDQILFEKVSSSNQGPHLPRRLDFLCLLVQCNILK